MNVSVPQKENKASDVTDELLITNKYINELEEAVNNLETKLGDILREKAVAVSGDRDSTRVSRDCILSQGMQSRNIELYFQIERIIGITNRICL